MQSRLRWWLVFLLSASPAIYFTLLYVTNPRSLGVDPIETLLEEMGSWALRFLLVTLSCSPLRRLGFKVLAKYRRMLGLYAFFYASAHMLVYVVGWIELEWVIFLEDVLDRPFIYIGMMTWIILAALAITSPKYMMKKLKRHWLTLHKGIYLATVLTLIHLWLQSRASTLETVIYGSIATLLIVERLYRNKSLNRLVKSPS